MDSTLKAILTILPIFSLILAAATFFIGRFTAHRNAGEKTGAMASDLGYIKAGIDDLKKELRDLRDGQAQLSARMAVAEQEIKTIWKQIDTLKKGG